MPRLRGPPRVYVDGPHSLLNVAQTQRGCWRAISSQHKNPRAQTTQLRKRNTKPTRHATPPQISYLTNAQTRHSRIKKKNAGKVSSRGALLGEGTRQASNAPPKKGGSRFPVNPVGGKRDPQERFSERVGKARSAPRKNISPCFSHSAAVTSCSPVRATAFDAPPRPVRPKGSRRTRGPKGQKCPGGYHGGKSFPTAAKVPPTQNPWAPRSTKLDARPKPGETAEWAILAEFPGHLTAIIPGNGAHHLRAP